MTTLNSKIPEGPIKDKWTTYKDKIDLVNPANKRNIASDNIGSDNIGNGNIGMGGLDVAFAIPSKPSTSGYRVHIGTYRNETDAHRAHHLLEQPDHYLLDHVFFNVAPQQRRNAI